MLPVLIVGAGPTGLNLALRLRNSGIPFRLVDKKSGIGGGSRAMVVHARTLELYDQIELAEPIIRGGIIASRASFRSEGKPLTQLDWRHLGKGLSPYPYVLCYPQDEHELLLVRELERLGEVVEWRTEVKAVSQVGNGLTAELSTGESLSASFIVGCDGSHSEVRHHLGLGFEGGTYEQAFYVADVNLHNGIDQEITIDVGPENIALMFPIRSSGMYRLIGTIPDGGSVEDFSFADVQARVERQLGISIDRVNWCSPYRVHHRMTEKFRVGNIFLAGDACHIHSPAGGQGMNTGIGDAVNLAWKLAEVLHQRADMKILDSYEEERSTFARKLLRSTDKTFKAIVDGGNLGRFTRRVFFPHMLQRLLDLPYTRDVTFRALTQTGLNYRGSALSRGRVSDVEGGDRLPWFDDNFHALRNQEWQLFHFGRARIELEGFTENRWTWGREAEAAGFRRSGYYFVRPDGYVAVATRNLDHVRDYIQEWGLCPRPTIDKSSTPIGLSFSL